MYICISAFATSDNWKPRVWFITNAVNPYLRLLHFLWKYKLRSVKWCGISLNSPTTFEFQFFRIRSLQKVCVNFIATSLSTKIDNLTGSSAGNLRIVSIHQKDFHENVRDVKGYQVKHSCILDGLQDMITLLGVVVFFFCAFSVQAKQGKQGQPLMYFDIPEERWDKKTLEKC